MPVTHLPTTDGSPAASLADGADSIASRSQPLRSRNIGVLCDDPSAAQALLLRDASTELGARVALVRSDLGATSGPVELAHTARVLGRLYDAILCVDLAPSIVQALRDAAGIPVLADDGGEWFGTRPVGADAMESTRSSLLRQLAAL